MTSSTTGDRRWGTTRRSGMTILGKVAVPKPINLPSQRLENQGLDPNVEIVPKGTLSWGSKSSLNAWGTSSLSPRTESGPGSPSHLSNLPSSGGSVTRPSTADSNKAHEFSSSIAWDSNSRPSSASGVFPSNQASVALQRPHSADTRPGSSQLSRFAEPMSETSATWGQHVAAEKLGVAPAKNDGFSLTSNDFPSLGAEKESSDRKTRQQDAGPHTRPASSSGRPVEEGGVDCTEEANERIGDANSWRRDNQPYGEDTPRHGREEGQLDSRGSQSFPNANFPHQCDDWRGPLLNNHQGGGWYRGNHPYGPPMGPGGFHMDPFPFYSTQGPPGPVHGVGPRGNPTTNERMFRPPILDSYAHPRMQTRPGFYVGPAPHEGYCGPPMGYGNPSNRDLPFAGRPAGPHAYINHSGQGGYETHRSSVAVERNEPSHLQETQRPYKVLLKPQDGRFGEDKAKWEEFQGNKLPNAEKIPQQMQTLRNERRENRIEASGEVQPAKAIIAAPEDPSLIQKIEGLSAKSRTNDGWRNASSVVNRDGQESRTPTVNSGNSVYKVSERITRTGKNSLHYNPGDPATNRYAEQADMNGTAISRRSTQQTPGRENLQIKQRVDNEGNDGRRTNVVSDSSPVTLATNSESFHEVNIHDSLDTNSIRRPGSGISADPNDNQRSTMRELAKQCALQREKEEEERARDRRAKALAKLEDLNRRSEVSEEGSVKKLEAASNAPVSDMPENPQSHSPALLAKISDPVHVHSSHEMKTTIAAENSEEPIGQSRKKTMPEAGISTENANDLDPTQRDNLPRDHDGATTKQKRLGYKQKQNLIFEKKTSGNSFSDATTEVSDVVPSPAAVTEGILSRNSDIPATSSISNESTITKRKYNRNGKKKHKAEETTMVNRTRVSIGKETKLGDESIETARSKATAMELGSGTGPSLDIRASGDSFEQTTSVTNEESQSRAKNNWKSQHLRRTQRNSVVNKPAEKFPGSNTVVWAPIHPQQKADVSTGVVSQYTVPESGTSSKSLHQGQTSSKSKRVEIERYIAKPIVKEMAEKNVSKILVPAAPDILETVPRKEDCGDEGTGILQPSGSTAGKSGSPSKSRHVNGRQGKHGREHGSWHQKGSGAPTKALEDGKLVTSNQSIGGTVKYQTSNQPEQIAAKDQTTYNDDGWNDGWHMTPETHYSAAKEMEANAAGKDQGTSTHGKQYVSRINKDGGSNYADPRKGNKRDSSKAHMQHSCHGLSQPDLPVASKESRGGGDNVWHTGNRTGKYGGRECSRDKTYGSQKKDVAGYEHQGLATEQKMTSSDTHAPSQNLSTNKEVQVEQHSNSMFEKNTGQNQRFGRGQESHGGWGSSAQEDMHHHHQRPHSNKDRQKQNLHYEYKPVGSHTYDGERKQEQPKESSQTEGARYREKGQGHQRHGGYQQQGVAAGRNTGQGLAGERN